MVSEAAAECKRCGSKLAIRHGTSSLRKHAQRCSDPKLDEPCPACPASCSVSATTSNHEPGHEGEEVEAKGYLARMIAFRGYDPSIVEDDYFRCFVRRLNPEFELPSHRAIEEMAEGTFDEAKEELRSKIRHSPGRISLAVGKAKTSVREVVYVACQFIDDQWNFHKLVIDAFLNAHDFYDYGPILPGKVISYATGEDFSDIISDCGISDRPSMLAYEETDDDICHELKDQIEKHFSNTYLTGIEISGVTYIDNVLHSVARCLLPDPKFIMQTKCDLNDTHHLTPQVHQQILSPLGLCYPRAHDEQWYRYYSSLEVLRNNGCIIETEFTKLLCKLWGQIYHAIERVSASRYTTSNLCLKELFKVREVLLSELTMAGGENASAYSGCSGFKNGEDAADVLQKAFDTLDRRIHDAYLLLSIPLVLDPRYKLRYIDFIFKRAFDSESAASKVAKVATKVKTLYTDYIGINDRDPGHVTTACAGNSEPLEIAWHEHWCSQYGVNVVAGSCSETVMELDRYLEDSVVHPTEGFDILNWWKLHSSEYPTVARMARDVLAMPTCCKLSSEQMAHIESIVRGYSKAVKSVA